MDISDATVELSFPSRPPAMLRQYASTGNENTEIAITNQEEDPKSSFIYKQIQLAENDGLREILFTSKIFKFYLLLIFVVLSYIMIWYGI